MESIEKENETHDDPFIRSQRSFFRLIFLRFSNLAAKSLPPKLDMQLPSLRIGMPSFVKHYGMYLSP